MVLDFEDEDMKTHHRLDLLNDYPRELWDFDDDNISSSHRDDDEQEEDDGVVRRLVGKWEKIMLGMEWHRPMIPALSLDNNNTTKNLSMDLSIDLDEEAVTQLQQRKKNENENDDDNVQIVDIQIGLYALVQWWRPDRQNLHKLLTIVTNMVRLGGDLNASGGGGYQRSIVFRVLFENWKSENEELLLPTVSRFLELGADPNVRDTSSQVGTPLLFCLLKRSDCFSADTILSVVMKCIEFGHLDLTIQDNFGRTALHSLVETSDGLLNIDSEKYVRIVTQLVEWGIPRNVQDKWGATVLNALVGQSPAFDPKSRETFLSLFTTLLDLGVNPNIPDHENRTALLYLMKWAPLRHDGMIQIAIRKLQECGAGMNVQDNHGLTALHCLMKDSLDGSYTDVPLRASTQLLEFGANPNIQDENGQTPSHILALNDIEALQSMKWRCLQALLRHKANPSTVPDNQGNCPLHYLGDPKAFDSTTAFLLLRHMVATFGGLV